RIVPLLRLVLHVRDRNRQNLRRVPPPLRLARLRHLVIADKLRHPPLRPHLRQRRRQRRLAMVHVPDRPHVHVRLASLIFRLRHAFLLKLSRLIEESEYCLKRSGANKRKSQSSGLFKTTLSVSTPGQASSDSDQRFYPVAQIGSAPGRASSVWSP